MSRKNATLAALACGLVVAIGGAGATAATAAECHPDARELRATYQPVSHSADATAVQARLTLDNGSRRCALPASGWKLYFNFVRQPLAAGPAGEPGDAARAQLAGQGLTLAHGDAAQSGDLYVLTPTSDFTPVGPGERRAIDLGVELWTILKTDAPAGFHIVFDGEPARWVPARALVDKTDPKQTTAFSGDANPVPTAASRFAENTSPPMALGLRDRILPRPKQARALPGVVAVGGGRTTIAAPGALRGEARYLKAALADVLRGSVTVVDHARKPDIALSVDPRLGAEAYTLDVHGGHDRGIRIAGGDAAGVLYGIQTLRQLIPADVYRSAASGRRAGAFWLPGASVSDAPLLGYRGLQIDIARHFQSPASLKKLIDLMAFLKLNRLHLHLTDDEGWRLQIPGLPELTGFGAHRGYDVDEERQLHQGMGSGSDLSEDDGVKGKARDQTEANLGRPPAYQGFENATLNYVGQGSGFLTTGDFQDLLRYAADRHIAVIPEFDMPAHARAAVQAMERRGDTQYRLADPDDTSVHRSVQGYTDNLVNPCLDSTYAFLSKVVHEVRAMYDAAGVPLTMINLGGDEAPGPDRWQHSPACAANPQTAGMDDKHLIDLFYTKWNAIAQEVAPKTAGWEDILLEGTGNLKLDDFVPLPWQNVWGWGREQIAYKLANAGTPVVLAHATNLYMDLAYNKDPDEPGYYWANFVDDKSTFTYQPFDVYANATNDRWGNPFTPDPSWERLTADGRKNIMGLEAQLWGENAKTPQIREYQAFPKLLGAATRAWDQDTPAPQQMPQAWDTFVNTVGQVTFPLLSFYQAVGDEQGGGTGVNYRIPLPGATVENGLLKANVRNPGLAIEWSTDGRSWRAYRGPVRVGSAPVVLRARAADGRTSRVSPVGVPAWSDAAGYPAGSLVTSTGDVYRSTRTAQAGGTAPADTDEGTWVMP